MGAKKYFKNEFTSSKFFLEHTPGSDFCVSSWQRNKNSLPLLGIRLFVFVGFVAIILASMILTARGMSFGYWFIFMTHWGLVMNAVTAGFGVAVSWRAHFVGPIDATFGLPWYVKMYWVLFNISVTLAFFITIYYYLLLIGAYEDFAVDPVLDAFIHGVNSVLMFVLLMTSRQPVHLLHFIHPLLFGLLYLLFSVIYYFAGGTDPFGNAYIYPTLDWGNEPLIASVSVLISALALAIIHFLVTSMAVGRSSLTHRFIRKQTSMRGSANLSQYN